MKANKYFLLITLIHFNLFLYAQKQNNIWALSCKSSIDFNTSSPTIGTRTYPMVPGNPECGATISDKLGNLLFFTFNETDIYNRNGLVMPNGLNSSLNNSSTQQGNIIIPKPNSESQYFLISSKPKTLYDNDIAYSVIDMSLDGGLGDVTQKNILLNSNLSFDEKLTASKHFNKNDFWLVSHDAVSNNFYAYLINKDGISSTPIISSVGSNSDYQLAGEMSISSNGCLLAHTIRGGWGGEAFVEVLPFDNKTGIVGSPIFKDTIWSVYGVEFSPDASKLYVTKNSYSNILQYDLLEGSAINILNSKTELIGPHSSNNFKIRLAPNNKIYFTAFNGYTRIASIENPNEKGNNCGLNLNAFPSLGQTNQDLPNTYNLDYDGLFCNEIEISDTTQDPIAENCNLILPNAFSPNDDGINDNFKIANQQLNFDMFKISIYNRWGELVFMSDQPNFRWDGTFKGQKAPIGVYYYFCNYICKSNNKTSIIKGDITLIR